MKQLQWDKLPQQQAAKTLWGSDSAAKEREWIDRLQSDGVLQEMEDGFKAKELVRVLIGGRFSSLEESTLFLEELTLIRLP